MHLIKTNPEGGESVTHSTAPFARQVGVSALLLVIVAAIAVLGSMATIPNTEGWYTQVEKAPWSPPNWVFGPAWSVLYVMIAVAGFLMWRVGFVGHGTDSDPTRRAPNRAKHQLNIYAVQLLLNALWTPIFFAGYPLAGEAAWWVAFVVIVALIVTVIWLITVARNVSKLAVWLLVPYLLWLVFASTLNAAIIALN